MACATKAERLEDATFLLCIGAAKTGTTWLYNYLGSREDIAVSPIKEMHFFDAKFSRYALGDPDDFAVKRLEMHLKCMEPSVGNLSENTLFQAHLDRVQMIYDDRAYFDHFERVLTPQSRVFCDITPGYSTIGREGFEFVKGFCEKRGVRVKVLFLMRDPIERLWSQIRHLQQLSSGNDAVKYWSRLSDIPAIRARTDYAETVQALDAVFPEGDVLHLFYESLFEEPSLRNLCSFLNVPYSKPGVTSPLNETKVKTTIPKAAKDQFRSDLAPQYTFCADRFGAMVPDTWAEVRSSFRQAVSG